MRLPNLKRRGSSRGKRRQARVAQSAALALVAATLAVLAINYDGSPVSDVELNDGGVWVTNSGRGTLGRFNAQVKEFDLAVATSSTTNTVFQQGSAVQVFDDGGSADSSSRVVTVVDVITGTPLPVALEGDFDVAAAGSTVVLLDNASGKVWMRQPDQLEGFDPGGPTDLQVSERGAVTVTRSGTALVSDRAKGAVTALRIDETGSAVATDTYEFDEEFTDDAQLSAVGEVPVVLQEGRLYRPGEGGVEVPGGGVPLLQQPGPESDDVYVTSETGLFRAGVSGGDPEEVSGLDVDGAPAAPVVVDGCVHAAWNDPGTDNYALSCGDDVTTGEVQDLSSSANLVFRVNRSVVVLNDILTGDVWPVQQGMEKYSDWESVDPKKSPQKAEADDDAVRDQQNEPPKAEPDTYGVRAGSTAVLPVTLNDVDPDGDILVIPSAPAAQGGHSFSLVGDGTQIQARISVRASGQIRFKYQVTDGRPGHAPAEAEVTLNVVGDSVDTAPKIIAGQKVALEVARGFQASVNVLGAYLDPEGDSVVLTGASADGGTVGFRPDGTIDFADDGRGGDVKEVNFTLKGGKAEKDYSFQVTVSDPEKAKPRTVADHFSGAVNARILLEPLTNDTDPQGRTLSLARIRNVSERPAQVARDDTRGTATFKADQPGSYYLEYVANGSNGVAGEEQIVRVDVFASTGTNQPPVAMRDIAAVRDEGSVLVDVLANDTDPDGDVLVVQGVRVNDQRFGDTVKASLVNKRFVRVETSGELDGEPEIEYLLSDGRSDQVAGAVTVTSASSAENRPPVAVEDIVTARAGSVITIPVLDNDEDPDGDRLTVVQADLFDVDPRTPVIAERRVPVVASGSSIKVLVPDDGTTRLQIGYGARDGERALGSSRLVLNIKPDDPKDNQQPQPPPIEDRTVTGQRIRVDVNVFGADPDGDPLVFAGVVQPPRLGRIVAAGADWFEYEPLEGERSTGTDSFKIQVADPYGLLGTADVRVGVARPAAENQPPSALDDEIAVKPDLTLQYPVLVNDSDPDGDSLILDEADLAPAEGTKARLVDGVAIEVDVPGASGAEEVSQVVQYVVRDGLGGSASAVLRVTAYEDAPDHAPTAQDDVVTAEQLRGKEEGDTVAVDILKNDGDIDGSRSDLEFAPVDDSQARVKGRELEVTLRAESQVIPYRVEDRTDQVSFGFVYVTGTEQMAPLLDTSKVPVDVTAGETETIDLTEIVVVRPGHDPFIGNVNEIEESNGDAKPTGDSTLEWRSPKDYYGPASLTLPVLDEQSYNTPGRLLSQITVPITVLPSFDVPPTVRDTAVTLYAGGDPVDLRLKRLAQDPNPDDELSFEVRRLPEGVSQEITDEELVLRASDDAPSSAETVIVDVSDGSGKPVEARIRLTVIGGDDADRLKAPMTLSEIRRTGAVDEEISVDVREAILSDPFPGEDKSIGDVETSGSDGTARADGTTLEITPREDGELVVTYVLDDGSGDESRAVTGRVVVTVAGKPDKPGTPRGVEGGPDSVQLTWTAPDDNGSPITGYRVEGDPGGEAECQQTQCTVEGLKAGTSYRFRVVATNGEGDSEPSGWSTPVQPDEAPGKMDPPRVVSTPKDRDGQLTVQWAPPPNEGSDITHYHIEVSGNGPRVADPTFGQTQATISGLENGTSYQFRILAVNDRGEGVPSDWSAADHPFTVPAQVSKPTLVSEGNDNGNGSGYLKARWAAPDDGGDQILGYEVRLLAGGSVAATQPAGADALVAVFDSVENGKDYTVEVRAKNAAGTQETWSPASDATSPWDRSLAVTGIKNTSDCPGNDCASATNAYFGEVTFTTPADNGGFPVTAYAYSTAGTSGRVAAPSQAEGRSVNIVVPFASTASGQSVTLTPITEPKGVGEKEGASATGGSFSPYAKPFTPTRSNATGGYRSVSIAFDCNGNGRGVDDHRWPDTSAGGSASGCGISWSSVPSGEKRCATLSVHTAAGWSDESSQVCAQSSVPSVSVSVQEEAGNPPGPCTQNCDAVVLEIRNFDPGTHAYTTNIVASTGGPALTGTINADGTGYGYKKVAYYDRTVYAEEYCVYFGAYSDCATGR